MSLKLGHKSKVCIGVTEIGQISSFGPVINVETVDARIYGDTGANPVVVGRYLSCTIEGFLDLSDAKQLELHSAILDYTSEDPKDVGKIEDLRFYEDATNYWTVETVGDAEARFVITGYTWTPDPSGLTAVSFDIQSVGEIKRTS